MKKTILGLPLVMGLCLGTLASTAAPVRADEVSDLSWKSELQALSDEVRRLQTTLRDVEAAANGPEREAYPDLGSEVRTAQTNLTNVSNSIASWILQGKTGEGLPIWGSFLRQKARGDVGNVRNQVSRLVALRNDIRTFLDLRKRFLAVDARGKALHQRYEVLKTWYDGLSHSWVPVFGAPSDWRRDAADQRGWGKCGNLLWTLGRHGMFEGVLNPNQSVTQARNMMGGVHANKEFWLWREYRSQVQGVVPSMESAAAQLEQILVTIERIKDGKVKSPAELLAQRDQPAQPGRVEGGASGGGGVVPSTKKRPGQMGMLGVETDENNGGGTTTRTGPGGGTTVVTRPGGEGRSPAAPAQPKASNPTSIKVEKGDTLWELAVELLTKLKAAGRDLPSVPEAVQILAHNGVPAITNPNLIFPGQVISVPANLR